MQWRALESWTISNPWKDTWEVLRDENIKPHYHALGPPPYIKSIADKKNVTMLWIIIFNLVLTWSLCARYYSKHLKNVLITALSHRHYHLPHNTQEKVEAEGKRPTCCTAVAETDIWMLAASIQILCITRRFYFLTVQLASRKGILFFTLLNAWGKNKLRKTGKLGNVMSKS